MAQKPLGYQQTADASAVLGMTDLLPSELVSGENILAKVGFCYVQAEAQACRWTDDGTDPAAGLGQLLAVGQTLVITRGQFNAFQIIEETSGAKVNVTAYQYC